MYAPARESLIPTGKPQFLTFRRDAMEPTAKYGILLTITKWLAAVSIPLFIFRVATKRAITRGARFKTSQALIIAGAPFLTISAACSTAAVLMFGPFGAVGWMCAAIFLAYWYVFTPGQEKEDWLRVEM